MAQRDSHILNQRLRDSVGLRGEGTLSLLMK